MLFDTHAHMDDRAFDGDREALLEALPGSGIGLLVNPGCSLASSEAACVLAREYGYIYAAVGSHPDAADEVDEAALDRYRQLVRENSKVVAIGEIGLDYHYEDIPRDIHEREAHEDGMKIVEEFPEVTGVFHCYSGSAEMAKVLVSKGWYVGFTGVLTFKNARRALEAAQAVPRDRVVLETDCPYMSPEPFRGQRNDPRRLYRMAEALAALWEVTPEEAQAITFENGKRLYRIE